MILSRVSITNYKHYGGSQEIEIPQAGTIGVIGTNGVGKTTLFEAIEWALYSPSTIKAADVRPRTWRGSTIVAVVIDDPATGAQYTVERELGKGSAKARIYRSEPSGIEEKIVEGAPQVTAYVANHLIGLDHDAFVATFFTRQKELGFFNGSPTARRREVGKLLGLETIREAQEIVAEQRKRAQSDARSYLNLYESQSRDRDFAAEIAAAEAHIGAAIDALATMAAQMIAAKSAVQSSQQALSAIEGVRDQDNELGQRLLRTQREFDLARQQIANAAQELERLASAEADRAKLAPIAAGVAELEEAERQFTRQRQANLRKRELSQLIEALSRRERDQISAMQAAVQAAPAPDRHAAWNTTNLAEAIAWADRIDIETLEERTQAVVTAYDIAEKHTAENATLRKYRQRVEQLQTELAAATSSGDPATRIDEIDQRLQALQASTAAAESTGKRVQTDLQRSERILANLHAQHEGEVCPTCQRPFTAADTRHVIAVFERDVAGYRQQLDAIRQQVAANAQELARLQQERMPLIERTKTISATQASIENGARYVDEQSAKVDELDRQLQRALVTADLTSPPNVHQYNQAIETLQAWRKVKETAAILRRGQRALAEIEAERVPTEQELDTLADAAYDEAAHRALTLQVQSAREAQATVVRIDQDLARRPGIEQARNAAAGIAETKRQQLVSLQDQRTALNYDAQTLVAAQRAREAALDEERAVSERHYQQRATLREAEHARDRVREDQERVAELATTAESKRREADDLDQVYREFTEFERYAAAWYAPRLSDITSDLVSQVTDGKYSRVEFDNNFSIQVYDGDDEKYPYETFSGGERDAIALCARIALSRVIGGASATPPGFLVLDEVFGSLDLERRQRLLEMLGAITNANDQFQQVFIISHVDDIRTSPILDDIWLVRETDDGVSRIEMVSAGADIGEI